MHLKRYEERVATWCRVKRCKGYAHKANKPWQEERHLERYGYVGFSLAMRPMGTIVVRNNYLDRLRAD